MTTRTSHAVLLTALALTACAPAESQPRKLPPNLYPVQPGKAPASRPAPPASTLRLAQGRFFTYALPEGWRVGEDGQFALTLVAPDQKALTVMVGNAGLPPNYPPGRFAYEKLMALRPMNLQLGPPRQAAPVPGFAQAWQFDVSYIAMGLPCRGSVKVNVLTAYDSAVMAMNAALSEATQWPGYANWLPLVAEQTAAANGAAFGMRGVMQQNLANSTAYAEAARQYRHWSQRTLQETSAYRNSSIDRRNEQFRENLGAVQTYVNPYEPGKSLELTTQYKYFWIDRQGNILGSNDPSADPNAGSTSDWRRMPTRP